jgi:hypothetical protein
MQRAEEGDREAMAKAKETLLMEQKVRWEAGTHHHSQTNHRPRMKLTTLTLKYRTRSSKNC